MLLFHYLPREEEKVVTSRRARIYDAIALLVVSVIIVLDQWTKSLVVAHLGPPDGGPTVSLIRNYLVLITFKIAVLPLALSKIMRC